MTTAASSTVDNYVLSKYGRGVMDSFRSESWSINAGQVSEADLPRGHTMLDGAAQLFPQLGAASPLGTVRFSACADRVGVSEGDRGWEAGIGGGLGSD